MCSRRNSNSRRTGRTAPGSTTLLYRLNSISHTLLALLHSDRTRDTVNKILYEVLTMFRGDGPISSNSTGNSAPTTVLMK